MWHKRSLVKLPLEPYGRFDHQFSSVSEHQGKLVIYRPKEGVTFLFYYPPGVRRGEYWGLEIPVATLPSCQYMKTFAL